MTAPTRTIKGAKFYRRFGYVVIAALFGGLGAWSFAAPIDGAVIAGGTITVEGDRRTVQHLEGGILASLSVSEGDLVKAGDVLAVFEDTLSSANLSLVENQLADLYANRARLIAERDNKKDLVTIDGIESVLSGPKYRTSLKSQRDLFNARRAAVSTQISLNQERIRQQDERILGFEARISSLAAQQILVDEEHETMDDLFSRGLATKGRVTELKRDREAILGEVGSLRSNILEARSIIAESQLEIEQVSEDYREAAIGQLAETEASISELEERLNAAEYTRRQSTVTSPIDGHIIDLKLNAVGTAVTAGSVLMEIVPANSSLTIQTSIPTQHIDRISVGQRTRIRFVAFGASAPPEGFGVVSLISADTTIDENTGLPYFKVFVGLPPDDQLSGILKGQDLRPGMPVEAFLLTEPRSAVSFLLQPLWNAFDRSFREE